LEDRLRVGVVTSPHGVHGEVKVFPTTDDVNRFKLLKKVYISGTDLGEVFTVKSVKFFKNLVILSFEEVTDRNNAEKLAKKDILIDRKDAVPLGEDEYFICDIIGFKVISDTGEELGVLTDVLTSSANDVYVINDEKGREILVPSIKECLISTDIEKKVIVVHLLKGMV